MYSQTSIKICGDLEREAEASSATGRRTDCQQCAMRAVCSRCGQPCYLLEFERPSPDGFLSQRSRCSGLVAVLVKRVPFQPSALPSGSRHRTISHRLSLPWNWESIESMILGLSSPLTSSELFYSFSHRHQSHFSLLRAVDCLGSVLVSVVVFASGFFHNFSLMLSCHGNVFLLFLLFLLYNYNIVQRFTDFR